MSNTDIVTPPLSRPKIHRLPVSLSSHKRSGPQQLSSFVQQHLVSHAHRGMKMTILLVTVSAGLFIASQMVSGSRHTDNPLAVARLEPASGDAMASIPRMHAMGRNNKTIHIEGKSEAIVGQLARIPSENGNISDIKTVSEVDNRAGRELLSIIGKY
jgi:hypothetical protein